MKKKIIPFIVAAMIVVVIGIVLASGASSQINLKGPKITISAGPTDTFTPDDIPPVITITGSNPATINVGDSYNDEGATATDNIDGDITNQITKNSNVNTAAAGTYSVIYYVTDSAGNHAQDTRVVNVQPVADDIPPVITITGNNPVVINVDDTYVDEGATATDNIDGDITNQITKNSNVNTAAAGTYSVIYYVTDSAGNHAQDTRVVNVEKKNVDTTPPTIIAPANITKIATGDLTNVNLGNPEVSDDTDNNPLVTNDAPAGYNFPLGTTQVMWTAIDNYGNSNSSIQFVTIDPAPVKLAITNYTPEVTTIEGTAPSNIVFNIITNHAANVVWNLDGVSTPGGQSVTEDSYSTNIPKIGSHTLIVTVQNGTDSNSVTWNLDIKGKLEIVASPSSINIGKLTNVTFKVNRKCGIIPADNCTGSIPVPETSISLSGIFTGSGITNSAGEFVIAINTTTNGSIEARASKSGYIDGNTTIISGIAPAPTPPPSSGGSSSGGGSSGGSSGGGGGGSASAEPFDNIYKYEVQENQVSTVPVPFKYRNPELAVYEVMVTSKQIDMASLRIEVLKGTSKLVNVSAPGIVYKNINAWIDYKRIKNATMRFKVENSWMSSNGLSGSNVKMSKWDTVNKKWIELLTVVTNKDDVFTYFEAQNGYILIFCYKWTKI